MKVIALTTAVMFAATSAFAGNVMMEAADPAPMVEMMESDAGSAGSMGGMSWLLPLIIVGAIVAASDD